MTFMIVFRKAIALGGILAIFGFSTDAQAQLRVRQTREEYIERYKSIAINDMERYGIPASITLAQGILESDSGNSRLSLQSNNHFGIKCKSNWTGKRVYHDDDAKGECFRSYSSVEESYRDHAEFLDQSPRYDSLFAYSPTDYRSWARGLKAAGYATAPDYAQRLIRIIEDNRLYLLDRPNGNRLYASHKRHNSRSRARTRYVDKAVSGGTVDPDNYGVTVNSHNGYKVLTANGVHYVLAKAGDTYETLGSRFRVSARNLRKFNDAKDPQMQPAAGMAVYIERKKRRWTGDLARHVCGTGETVRSVAQIYGVRSRSIEKMNHLPADATLKAGAELRIR